MESFLDEYGKLSSIIILTTSQGGDILPDMKDRNIDAIASASDIEKIEPVASKIIGKINDLIHEKQ